jgi:hypothetical protein
MPKPAPLASRHADGGGEDVQHGEHGRRHDRHGHNLIHRQLLTRDEHQRQGHGNALHHILDDTSQKIVHVHLVYIRSLDFFLMAFCWSKHRRTYKTEMSNQQEEDFLSEDQEISSQKIVLLSFLSPEKILANKDVFFFKNFLNNYELQWRSSKLEAWLAEQVSGINNKLEALAGSLEKVEGDAASGSASGSQPAAEVRKNLLRVDTLVEEFQQYTRKNLRELSEHKLQEEYDTYLFAHGQKLEEEFFKLNEFRTTMRGIKVRGVFSSEAEASAKAKRLQKTDPSFNIYLGHVGKWMAWEPDPNKVGEQEYANEELNTLMKKYRENEENRDVFYNEQKKTRIGAAKTKTADDVAPEATLTSTVVPVAGAETSYDGLFSGPADLAIARKMEKQ